MSELGRDPWLSSGKRSTVSLGSREALKPDPSKATPLAEPFQSLLLPPELQREPLISPDAPPTILKTFLSWIVRTLKAGPGPLFLCLRQVPGHIP